MLISESSCPHYTATHVGISVTPGPVCLNICVCSFIGGPCSEDNHCNLDHSRGNSSSSGVVWLSQESTLDRLELEKSILHERQSPLSSLPLICSTPTRTHTQTRTRAHTQYIFSPMCCNNCLPRPPLFPAHSGKMTCV